MDVASLLNSIITCAVFQMFFSNCHKMYFKNEFYYVIPVCSQFLTRCAPPRFSHAQTQGVL